MLQAAAVMGSEIDRQVLVELFAGAGEPASLFDLIEEALAAHVLATVPGKSRYRFVHELVRETVYEALSASRRTQLHGRIVEAPSVPP